jgi:hypothetical protein
MIHAVHQKLLILLHHKRSNLDRNRRQGPHRDVKRLAENGGELGEHRVGHVQFDQSLSVAFLLGKMRTFERELDCLDFAQIDLHIVRRQAVHLDLPDAMQLVSVVVLVDPQMKGLDSALGECVETEHCLIFIPTRLNHLNPLTISRRNDDFVGVGHRIGVQRRKHDFGLAVALLEVPESVIDDARHGNHVHHDSCFKGGLQRVDENWDRTLGVVDRMVDGILTRARRSVG